MVKNPPAKLYKYQCLNKQTIANLINGCIFFSQPENFDDPFDCWKPISLTDPIKDELEKFRDGIRSLPAKKKKKVIPTDQALQIFINVAKQEWIGRRKKVLKQMGVACFSATKADNILMWSQYADKHRGFCLEFDSEFHPFNRAEKVKYSENYEAVPAASLIKVKGIPAFHDVPSEVLWSDKITKSPCWKYEEEWRCFDGANVSCHYDNLALTGIYFGCRMVEEDKRVIYSILEGTKSSFYDMLKSQDEFKVTPEPYAYPVKT